MNYPPKVTTLERTILVRLARSLWIPETQDAQQVRHFCLSELPPSRHPSLGDELNISNDSESENSGECDAKAEQLWVKSRDRTVLKAAAYPLPDSLKKKLLALVVCVGWQIFQLVQKYQRILTNCTCRSLCHVNWTSYGEVDKRKTAQAIIREDPNLSLRERFDLACYHCLEGEISALWGVLDRQTCKDLLLSVNPSLQSYWSHVMDDKLLQYLEHESYQDLFRTSSLSCNDVAAEYFLQKLYGNEENEILVLHTALRVVRDHYNFFSGRRTLYPRDYHGAVLLAVLRNMDEGNRKKLYCANREGLLPLFLEGACRDAFLTICHEASECFEKKDYPYVLHRIFCQIKWGYEGPKCFKLLREFWQMIPICYRWFVRQKWTTMSVLNRNLVLDLCDLGDKVSVRLVLDDMTPSERSLFILCRRGRNLCLNLIDGNRWSMLEVFLKECIGTRYLAMKLKKELVAMLPHGRTKDSRKTNKLLRMLDGLVEKRK